MSRITPVHPLSCQTSDGSLDSSRPPVSTQARNVTPVASAMDSFRAPDWFLYSRPLPLHDELRFDGLVSS